MQELSVHYDPQILEGRIRSQRGRVISGSISFGLTAVGVLVAFLWPLFTKEPADDLLITLQRVLALSLGVSAILLAAYIVWLFRVKAGRREVGEGLALVLSSRGIETETGGLAWDEIEAVTAEKGRPGYGYRLAIRAGDRSRSFPLEGLDLLPGTLDAAARAYSAGRHGIDLTVVDD